MYSTMPLNQSFVHYITLFTMVPAYLKSGVEPPKYVLIVAGVTSIMRAGIVGNPSLLCASHLVNRVNK